MWPRFGVKISNSTFSIAYVKEDGKIEVIANKQGDRVTPACLISEENEIEVGVTAKQKMASKPTIGVSNNFQLFPNNLNEDQIENALKHIPCKFNTEIKEYELIKQGENKPHRSLTPYEVCVEFFKATFELARQCHLHEDHPNVVLSIPDYYPYACWKSLAEAAEEAGFHVAQIITEPTAAVLAYEIAEEKNVTKNVLYIKSGGICSSLTLFKINDGLYTVLNSVGPYYIGGNQITDALADFINKEFYKKYRLDSNESRRSISKIFIAAENCKHILTTLPSTQIYIDSLMDGVDFNMQMSRARFESIIQSFLNELSSTLTTALKELNTNNIKIDEIVLAGATLKIPKIQSMISSMLPDANLNTKFAADEVVAIGCARQSLFINPDHQDLEETEEISFTISDIFVWHNEDIIENGVDEDDKKIPKTLICKEGTIVPNSFRIDVEEIPVASAQVYSVKFNVQYADSIKEMQVENLKSENGKFSLEVSIELDEVDKYPVINLRSILGN